MASQEREIIIKVFKILLDNPLLFKTGLCRWILDVHTYGLISEFEYSLTSHYIENKIDFFTSDEQGYCWARGFLMYRINWINKQIKILEDEKN